jgi:diguanylate cyclase (GGDEF)-like protein/PAS domain S-box-containing protein
MASQRIPLGLLIFIWLAAIAWGPAEAGQIINAALTEPSIDILPMIDVVDAPTPEATVERPADATGHKAVMPLSAKGSGPPYRWAIFTTVNPGAQSRSLVLVVPHRKFAGSGIVWPRPEGRRAISVAVSEAQVAERLFMSGGDAFALEVPPEKSVTVAIELATGELGEARLWQRTAFDVHQADLTFFRGGAIGMAVLLSLAIVCLFILRPVAVFPAAALFAWPALLFLLSEADYLPDLAHLLPQVADAEAKLGAAIEAVLLAGFLAVLVAFAGLRRRMPAFGGLVVAAAGAAAGLAVYGWFEPAVAQGTARLGFAVAAPAGFIALAVLLGRRASRVRSTLLVWVLASLWIGAAAVSCLGIVRSDVLDAAVFAGLVLVVLALTIVAARLGLGDATAAGRHVVEAGRRALALAAAEQAVWEWQPEGAGLYVGPELERALGLATGTLSGDGMKWLDHVHPDDRAAYSGVVEGAAERGRGSLSHEFRLRRGDGTYRWYQLRARVVDADSADGARLIGTLADITASRRSEDRILSDAVRDRVTGLPNRALFIDRLERAMRRAGGEEGANLHVIVVDLDRFKSVNDGLGHEVGDSLLNIIGRRLSRLLAPDDTLARLPGDQFAIIFNGSKPARDIITFSDRLRQEISEPINLRPREVFITATLGVAGFEEGMVTPEDFLRSAEIALFEAKRRGKDMIEFFRPDMLDARSHLIALEQDLHRAIERNEIEVVYQPIMRLGDGELAGFEALVRWRHGTHGLLEPDSFMGLAEETGIVKALGRYVLDEAVRQVGVWKRAFRPSDPLFVSVNLSFSQLLGYDLVDEVRSLLAREGIPGSALKLEITESLVMQNPELSAGVLRRLNQLGVTLACDDFGTGYSTLANLNRLPFDTLKIDRALIESSDSDPRAAVVLDAIVAMAHGLGLSIVAEGVETEAQVRRLMALGCDLAQGYLVGRPVTARQIAAAFGGVPYGAGRGQGGIAGFWRRLVGSGATAGRGGEEAAETAEGTVASVELPTAEAELPPPPAPGTVVAQPVVASEPQPPTPAKAETPAGDGAVEPAGKTADASPDEDKPVARAARAGRGRIARGSA